MKFKWRVDPEPTGRYRSFDTRAWPSAVYDNDQQTTCAMIQCDDEYTPERARTGNHAPLKLCIADHRETKFNWMVAKNTFATLKEAKAALTDIIARHPELAPAPKAAMNELQIRQYLHCAKCIEELPAGTTPQEFRALDVGFTEKGLQVWCVRHDMNIVHIDFQGKRHPADTTARKTDG